MSWNVAGDLASRGAFLGTIALAASMLNPEAFGRWTALYALALFAAAIWDLGSSPLLTREIAVRRTGVVPGIRRALLQRLALIPVTVAVTVGLIAVADLRSAASSSALILAGLILAITTQNILLASLRGLLMVRASATALTIGRLVGFATAVVIAMTTVSPSLQALLGVLLVGETVTVAVAAGRIRRVDQTTLPNTSSLTVRAGLPFSVTSLMNIAYNRLDVVIVAAIGNVHTLAAYAPATRIQDALSVLPFAALGVLFPVFATYFAEGEGGREATQALWKRAVAIGLPASLTISFLGFALFPTLIDKLLPSYAIANDSIKIIVWSLPLQALNYTLMALVNARNRAELVSVAVAVAFGSALVLNLLLIPIAGAEGAALAAVLRDAPAAVVLLWAARRAGLRIELRRFR
jgi:O-antigen/teichoic acid export membrane protein